MFKSPPRNKQTPHVFSTAFPYTEAYPQIDVLETTKLSEESIELQLAGLISQMRGKPEAEKREILVGFLELLSPSMRKTVQTKMKSYGLDVVLKGEEKKNCKNGNCQKIINESELETWLAKGWKYVAILPSGKIVVSNE